MNMRNKMTGSMLALLLAGQFMVPFSVQAAPADVTEKKQAMQQASMQNTDGLASEVAHLPVAASQKQTSIVAYIKRGYSKIGLGRYKKILSRLVGLPVVAIFTMKTMMRAIMDSPILRMQMWTPEAKREAKKELEECAAGERQNIANKERLAEIERQENGSKEGTLRRLEEARVALERAEESEPLVQAAAQQKVIAGLPQRIRDLHYAEKAAQNQFVAVEKVLMKAKGQLKKRIPLLNALDQARQQLRTCESAQAEYREAVRNAGLSDEDLNTSAYHDVKLRKAELELNFTKAQNQVNYDQAQLEAWGNDRSNSDLKTQMRALEKEEENYRLLFQNAKKAFKAALQEHQGNNTLFAEESDGLKRARVKYEQAEASYEAVVSRREEKFKREKEHIKGQERELEIRKKHREDRHLLTQKHFGLSDGDAWDALSAEDKAMYVCLYEKQVAFEVDKQAQNEEDAFFNRWWWNFSSEEAELKAARAELLRLSVDEKDEKKLRGRIKEYRRKWHSDKGGSDRSFIIIDRCIKKADKVLEERENKKRGEPAPVRFVYDEEWEDDAKENEELAESARGSDKDLGAVRLESFSSRNSLTHNQFSAAAADASQFQDDVYNLLKKDENKKEIEEARMLLRLSVERKADLDATGYFEDEHNNLD